MFNVAFKVGNKWFAHCRGKGGGLLPSEMIGVFQTPEDGKCPALRLSARGKVTPPSFSGSVSFMGKRRVFLHGPCSPHC